LLTVAELAPHYQLVVDRAATLARLEVQVEPAPELLARCGGFAAEHPEIGALRASVRRAAPARRRASAST
jgi:phenylacetate-coenzyme A ligase PaaK-like adenylate-forming protein